MTVPTVARMLDVMVFGRPAVRLMAAPRATPILMSRPVRSLEDRIVVLRELVWGNGPSGPTGSLRDAQMRQIGLAVTRACPPRGDECELRAIFEFIVRNVRYTGDITDKDTFQTALRTLQYGGGDCFPMSQKIICRSKSTGQYELLRLGELRHAWPAYEALSYNFHTMRQEFRSITAFQDKGEKEVLRARLSNGTDLVATEDHKFWALDGQKSRHFQHNLEPRCLGEYAEFIRSRPGSRRHERVRILQAARIPTLDVETMSRAEAYLAGIYAAEGYSEEKRSKMSIAQFRPEIRARIEEALAEAGASARFQPPRPSAKTEGSGAYYALHVGDGALVDALRSQGRNSFDKRLPMAALSGTREIVETIIGAHGDGDAYHPKAGSVWADKVSAIYATSSDELAEDLRLGLLALGRPFYLQHQKDHQGAGRRPIWRLYEWHSRGLLRREEAIRDVLPGLRYGYVERAEKAGRERVGCITVDENHNFFLADGTLASNCDDHSVLSAVLGMENGFRWKWRITSNTGATWDHIYGMAGIPKHRPARWVALDTTIAAGKPWPMRYFGVEPPRAKFRDFSADERG